MNMNSNEAYEILDSISDKNEVGSKDLSILIQLSRHNDSEIRSYVAELLVLSDDRKAENVLINLCNDEDELVRVNACDSLSVFATNETYNQLIKSVLNDKSTLVKSYAILSIADIVNYIEFDKKELKKLLISNSKSDDIGVYAACYKGLYILGEDEYLNRLLDLIKSDNYQDRCAILNMIEDIITEKNSDNILPFIKELRETEQTNAVNSTIDRIIKTRW